MRCTKLKLKLNFKSIRFKVWMYFLIFTFVILFLIWFLQIFFLNNYYEKMKIVETQKTIATITDSYQHMNQEAFFDKIESQIDNDDIFVKVVSEKKEVFSSNDQIIAYKPELEKAQDSLSKISKDDSSIALTLQGEKTKRETWIYAGYLDASHDMTLYVVAPLYPVTSTIKILQNQLIYITLISLIFAFALSVYISSRISKPISRITDGATKLANGEYGITFPSNYAYSEINELANTLNKTSSELEKSVNMQKDLMANVSHDLKTPLTMVKSYAEMIRDLSGDNAEKRNAHLQVIIDESDRLNKLVNDILTLSAVQAGTLELNITKFSIKDLVASLLQPYELLKEQGYHIMFNCRQDVEVIGDEERIKQVVSNLLTNAIKYCGEDKKIFVNIKKWGKRVHCEIVDHGQGIKPDELPYIWEKYYKSSTNHVRATKGSGIGLSIVKTILTAHNARFGAESKVGRGTTFWFELEVAPEPKHHQTPKESWNKLLH